MRIKLDEIKLSVTKHAHTQGPLQTKRTHRAREQLECINAIYAYTLKVHYSSTADKNSCTKIGISIQLNISTLYFAS